MTVARARVYGCGMQNSHDLDPRRIARGLYWQGWGLQRIAEQLRINPATLQSWKRRDEWDASSPIERVDATLEARLMQLITKEQKDGRDFKEIDLLGRQMERMARVNKFNHGGNEADLNPRVANRNTGPRKAAEKNAISDEQQERLVDCFLDGMFGYQKHWHEAGKTHRIRNLLKSRQIGATYFFAHEALVDAILTGRNQIFLSASRAQAHQFRSYIVAFAKSEGVELRGDPIILPNGAELIFLGTNSRTAQSYHGNLYLDEYFWIPKFQELRKVAAGMASHAKWRITYFSTPSAISHDAYPFWSGKLYNKGRPKADHLNLDISHGALAGGVKCGDGQWRQIVTVEDAEKGGCTLFDIDQLRRENSPSEFQQLYMCDFIDDGESVFTMPMMQRCMVDSFDWDDYKPFAARPLGEREVWIGYDPANAGDSAGCAVLSPPLVDGGKFRVLERHQFRGIDFQAQADAIRKMCDRYRVTHIGIDTTGLGVGVHQLVKQFFPGAKAINYSVDVKVRLVLKAYDVISRGRLEFDAGHTDVAASFMQIKKTVTPSGRQATYVAGRSEEASHADLAWAVMHALEHEPLEGRNPNNSSFLELF